MDTGTHIVMGIALGGLATLDPVVASDPATTTGVIIATIIGSQIPDIDTVLKLRNNAVYIRNHRGVTHSIPAVLLWPLLILAVMYPLFPEANLFHLWLWTFIAVFLHVFVDIFNAYGTQALRPFTNKWVALGIINTFDPIIFSMHIAAILFWVFGSGSWIYLFNFIYRTDWLLPSAGIYTTAGKNKCEKRIPDAKEIILSPTMRYNHWRIAVMTDDSFYVGRSHQHEIEIYDKFHRIPVPDTPVLTAAQKIRTYLLSYPSLLYLDGKLSSWMTNTKSASLIYATEATGTIHLSPLFISI